MGKIFVVGVGPGSGEFMTPAAQSAVDDADMLLGGKGALSMFPTKKPKRAIGADMDEALDFIRANRNYNIAVLTSGDPGFYSILDLLLKNFPKNDIEVIPGISSMQLCFARIREVWHDAEFVSVHGRSIKFLSSKISGSKKLVILTDHISPPNIVADFLLKRRIRGRAYVCDSLSKPSETVIESSLEEISRQRFSGNCVFVFLPEAQETQIKWSYRTSGIPDELFEKESSPMTKEEIRVITLSKTRIEEDSIIYDIGAGTGSISIEAGLLASKGQVFSIEKLPERVSIIKRNIRNFGVSNIEVVTGEAPEALENLPVADRIIIGGSNGRIKEILKKCREKLREGGIIVINAVTKNTLEASTLALKELGLDYDVIQVRINRRGETKLNPISVIYTRR